MGDVQSAVERIFPLVYEFRKPRTAADEEQLRARRAARRPAPACSAPAPAPSPAPSSGLHLVTLSDDDADEPDADAWE